MGIDRGARAGSHAKEGSSFKITTLIVIPVLAIIVPASVAIYIAKTPDGTSGNQSQHSGSQPGSPLPGAARGNGSSSASASTPTSDPTSTSNVPAGTSGHIPLYQGEAFTLNGFGCNNTYNYPNVIFGQHKIAVTQSTPSPPSGAFGLVLYCASNSNGGVLDPNIQYGGEVAILSDRADFDSCNSGIANSDITGSIPFDHLRPGTHLCVAEDSELALVTLVSVSQTSFSVTGTVTLWRVLASN